MKRTIAPLILMLLLLLSCTGCFGGADESQPPPEQSAAASSDDEPDWGSTVLLDGKAYRRRTDLKTVLFLGIDNTHTVEAEGIQVGNQGRADAVVLFILDKTAKTTQALAISRNAMTEVDIYKGNGDLAYSGVMQINMQYAFGDSPARGNFLMKRTVSELLYDTRIDGCLSMTMEGIAVIVDGMGGITITLPKDYTDIDESYAAGATVTLDGAAAERFVRYRDINIPGSAEDRLERQSWFVHTLFRQMKEQGNLEEQLDWMLETAEEYIETDVDAETIKMLADYQMLDETEKVPGTNKAGNFHDEYYVDELALRAQIVKLFYTPAE